MENKQPIYKKKWFVITASILIFITIVAVFGEEETDGGDDAQEVTNDSVSGDQEELEMIVPVGKMAYPSFVWNERSHVFDLEKVLEYYDQVTLELEKEYNHLYITFDYSSMSEAMYMSVRDNEENLMVISVRNHSNAQSQYDEVVKFCDHDNWKSVTEAVKDIINKNF